MHIDMQSCASDDVDKAGYKHRLDALMNGDPDCGSSSLWPDEALFGPPSLHYSNSGYIGDVATLIKFAQEDRKKRSRAVCIIEGISLDYACELGAGWALRPVFFVEHLKPLSEPVEIASLEEDRNPNSGPALSSKSHGLWGTVRAKVDHGKLPEDDENGRDLENEGPRSVRFSDTQSYVSHTNISFYKVNECLDLILVDKLPTYHEEFEVDFPPWLPNQSVIRMATLDGLRHLAIPQLVWESSTAICAIHGLFFDETNKEIMLRSIRQEGFDGFMYQVSKFECERHLNVLGQEIRRFNYDEIYNGGMETNQKLHSIRKVLYRLKGCIDENLAYEERLRRAAVFKTDLTACTVPARNGFDKLVSDIAKLERLLESCFQLLMMTMSAKNSEIMRELGEANREQTQANRQQTEAMVLQTHTMTMLSWAAFFYIPLTLATGIFGMNLKEINGSPLEFRYFVVVSIAILVTTMVFLRCYRKFQESDHQQVTRFGQKLSQLPSDVVRPIVRSVSTAMCSTGKVSYAVCQRVWLALSAKKKRKNAKGPILPTVSDAVSSKPPHEEQEGWGVEKESASEV